MPRRYYKKKRARPRYNRNRYRRKKRNKMTTVVIPRNRVQPDRLFVKLAYNDIKLLQSLVGSGIEHVYRANSCFDPDFTGTGEQPNGYDQWSNFYNRYRVHASKIEVKFIVTNTTTPDNAIGVSVTPSSESGVLGIFEDYIGNAYSKWEVVGPNTGSSRADINNYVSISKFQGKPGVKYDDVNTALVTANPARQTFWHIFAQTMNTGSGTTNIRYITRITYYVEFFDRKSLDES